MNERITKDQGICGGVPCIRHMRIPVWLVMLHVRAGRTAEEIVAEYPQLEIEDVHACIEYAKHNPEGATQPPPIDLDAL